MREYSMAKSQKVIILQWLTSRMRAYAHHPGLSTNLGVRSSNLFGAPSYDFAGNVCPALWRGITPTTAACYS